MWHIPLLATVFVSTISAVGVLTLVLFPRGVVNRYLSGAIAFAAGTLLGDSCIHLLPEAYEFFVARNIAHGFTFGVIGGIVTAYVIERVLHQVLCHTTQKQHLRKTHIGAMSLVGDAVHNFIDGIALAAAFGVSIPLGISATVAVLLHEIPQEIGDFGVLLYVGHTPHRALMANMLVSLTAIIGVAVGLLGIRLVHHIEGYLLAFAAGNFLYIALVNMIPEIHKYESLKRTIGHAILFCIGIGVMWTLVLVE